MYVYTETPSVARVHDRLYVYPLWRPILMAKPIFQLLGTMLASKSYQELYEMGGWAAHLPHDMILESAIPLSHHVGFESPCQI